MNNENNTADSGDIQGAAERILEELRNGPFAPALAGDILAQHGVQTKLVELIRSRLADQVVLLADQRLSPVGRPALALISKVRDPAYWAGYRLSSLYRIWDGAVVDLSALDRSDNESALDPCNKDSADFALRFPIGLRITGRVIRRSYTTAGFIVEVVVGGATTACFLPSDCLPEEFRTNPEALVGVEAEFEVASVLPTKKSVLLRFVKGLQSSRASQGADHGAADVERRLTLLRTLFEKRLISQPQYEAKQTEILSEL